MTRLTFAADPALKARYLARLRDHIEQGDFRFSPVWEDGKGSALGCTVEADDIAAYADQLGVPEALASVLDNLVAFRPYEPSLRPATDFALRWLATIPVGVDLSPVPGAMLCELLDHAVLRETVAADAAIDAVRRTVIALHRATLEGQPVSRLQWREVRRAAVRTTDGTQPGLTARAAQVIEAAAWPHLTRSTLFDTMNAVSVLVNDKALLDIGWTMAEEEDAFARLDAIFHEKAAIGQALVGEDLMAEFLRREPEHGTRFTQRNAAMMLANDVYIESGDHILRRFETL